MKIMVKACFGISKHGLMNSDWTLFALDGQATLAWGKPSGAAPGMGVRWVVILRHRCALPQASICCPFWALCANKRFVILIRHLQTKRQFQRIDDSYSDSAGFHPWTNVQMYKSPKVHSSSRLT